MILSSQLFEPSIFNEFYADALGIDIGEIYFVFGSNLKGVHGRGAAETACKKYGAQYGVGSGFTGQCYAIPTKDEQIQTLPLHHIRPFIDEFVEVTRTGDHRFFLSGIGCGLAGYKPKDIAWMFRGCQYCWFPESWIPYVL